MGALDLPPAAAALDRGALAATPRMPARVASEAEAARVGRDFEAMFLSQMLAPMFEGLDTDGAFGGGFGERMFRSLHVDAFARGIAERGGVGVAQHVARELLRAQESPHG
jgi:Rod binding domain-containing protein